MNEKICFVIMPFSDKDASGGNKWDDLFDHNIKPAVENAGLSYQCIRSLNPVGNFMFDIVSKLATAEIVIAVLTELRPNVMYELGIRNALRRKTIMLAENMDEVPSNLKAYIALDYSTKTADSRAKLTEVISRRLAQLDKEEPKSDNPVSDYLRDRAQDICDEWHENKNPQVFLPRLKEVLPSYALKLEPVLNKVSQHISEIEIRAVKNAEVISQQKTDDSKPEIKEEAQVVTKMGEALEKSGVVLTPSILRNMAFDAFENGDYEAAFELSERLVSSNSEDAHAWNIRGSSLAKLAKQQEALNSFDKSVQINPQDGDGWYNRAVALYAMDRFSDALKSYDKAVSLDSKNGRAWGNRGVTLMRLGKYAESLESLDKAVQINPQDIIAWGSRGLILERLGRHTESIESYVKSIEIEPTRALTWNTRGRSLFFLRRFDEAAKAFGRAFELEPTDANHINNKGFALEAANKIEEALECYDQAIQLDSQNAHALFNRGSALRKLNKDDEARKSIETALTINPKVGEEIEEQKRQISSQQ